MAQAIPFLIAGGTALSAFGTLEEGKAAERAGKIKAGQFMAAAKQSQASGTRKAGEIRRQGRVLQSDAAAAMAAGGGVTDDPGAIEAMAGIEKVVDYNALAALYEGETKAQEQRFAGRVARFEGKQAKKASRMKALSTVLSGGAQAFGAMK